MMNPIELKLFQAIEQNNFEEVKAAWQAGADIEALDTRNENTNFSIDEDPITHYNHPLHVAIDSFRQNDPENKKANALEIITFLIDKGADKEAIGTNGQRADIQKNSPLVKLPDEIILMIQGQLNMEELSSFAKTCVRLSNLARDRITLPQNIINDTHATRFLEARLNSLPSPSSSASANSFFERLNALPDDDTVYTAAIFAGVAGRTLEEARETATRRNDLAGKITLTSLTLASAGLFLQVLASFLKSSPTEPLFLTSLAMVFVGCAGCCFNSVYYDRYRAIPAREGVQDTEAELTETFSSILNPNTSSAADDPEENSSDEENTLLLTQGAYSV